ncbi:MAG: MBL fold metallo-hydrolase [Anaerovoracaceae bacterium]|jgi:7,8-dihydropterin-6-yl-methyl-4-(beta-D-ribofuranosyl)aminobenzene 5'-phosphate synthase
MRIQALVENTSISEEIGSEHGLSLYIEAHGYKILFDVGASGLFYENALKMDVDISDIDYLIISHGHYDHGGGLKTFLQKNSKAEVFVQGLAFEKYYARRLNGDLESIGLDRKFKNNRQIVLTSDRFFITKGIQLFSNIKQREPRLLSNKGLLMAGRGEMVEDIFAHEQNLVIEEDGKVLLVTGCSHNGIVNILKHFNDLKGRMPNYVVGGFHLSSLASGSQECFDAIDRIGNNLLETKAKFYTCHCTGLEPFGRLKSIMGDRIEYLSAGNEIRI